MCADVLSDRALNRALLARQGLLARSRIGALEMAERLVGLQAQEPSDPYVALWSRIEGFAPDELADLLLSRQAVRAPLIRPTIHLVSARDCLAQQTLAAPVMAQSFRSTFARGLEPAGVEPSVVAAAGRELLEDEPLTRAELRDRLSERWPEADGESLGHAVTFLNALVQVPPRGLWGRSGQARWALTERWLGAPPEPEPSVEAVALRYLAAFGPASPADMRVWSRLTGLRAVFERLRPQLRVFRSERGRELFDVPDGPLPDPATPAPPRFLPEYDNALLAHDDRSRVVGEHAPPTPPPTGRWIGHLLVDGFLRAYWKADVDGASAVLRIGGFRRRRSDPGGTRKEIEAEGDALLRLIAPGAIAREIRFVDEL